MKIYLASCYSHHCNVKRIERFNKVNEAAADLMRLGHIVFSPISQGHVIADYLPAPCVEDHGFWMDWCLPFLDWADRLYVYRLPGWEDSKGVRCEIEYALDKGKPIVYID